MSTPSGDARRLIESVRSTARDREYIEWALSARQQYVALRLRQDKEIRALYALAARRAGQIVRDEQQKKGKLFPGSNALARQMETLADDLNADLTTLMQSYVTSAAEIGTSYAQSVTVSLAKDLKLDVSRVENIFTQVNQEAIEASWARSKYGLKLSDRIWNTSQHTRDVMRDLMQESIAVGQDAVKTARMLTDYVANGKATIAANYPNMQERVNSMWPKGMTFQEARAKGLLKPGGSRVPSDVNYEALRLARTETSSAFGEGNIAASRIAPSYRGMRWILSASHPQQDICDSLALADPAGLGAGVYPPGEEPLFPAHVQCICYLQTVMEDREERIARRRRYIENPDSEPELQVWARRFSQGQDDVSAMSGIRLTAVQRDGLEKRGWLRPSTPEVIQTRKEIEDGTRPLDIQRGKQITHIASETQFTQTAAANLQFGFARSYLGTSKTSYKVGMQQAKEIVDTYHGTGALFIESSGNIREVIRVPDKVFGQCDSYDEGYIDTDTVEIIYSSKGTHVYPVHPDKAKRQ